ncbi:MAG: iron-sulfur cluster assembly accessory protein [Elainellaceae cyanobacterium]
MIHLSAAAIAEVNRIKSRYSNPEKRFRVGVKSGGCADLYYTMELDEAIATEDRVIDCNGIQVVIDPESAKYLDGLRLDYTEDLMGGGFRFHNPNAVSSCGCGNSFSVNPAPAPSGAA